MKRIFPALIILGLPLWFSGNIVRVSETPNGSSGNGESDYPRLSADGKTVAFRSSATNLLPQEKTADGHHQIYVRNLESGSLVQASVGQKDGSVAVSYTHLTLPTKRIV